MINTQENIEIHLLEVVNLEKFRKIITIYERG